MAQSQRGEIFPWLNDLFIHPKMEPAWEKVHGSKFRLMFRTIVQTNGGTREVPCNKLTKTECLYIATRVTRIEWYLFLIRFFLQKIANGKWYMKKKS